MTAPKDTARVTLVLLDDSEVVRTGLRTLLSTDPRLEILGEAGTLASGVETVTRLTPDVVLLDIRLPDGNGFEACRQILKRAPETRVLILTSSVDDTMVDEAIRSGANGYLLKEIDGRGLINAIHDVAAGKSILDPAVTARVMQMVKTGTGGRDALGSLSPQEKRVLALIAEGCTNKEVGVKLGLSEKTVKNYLSTVFEKLHVSRRAEAAVIYAQENRK
ncbi:MAG TPA: response regulator transcription factor [Opitutaceae bacterium]|nr:response regulator transcription factor [Opitutaceae bacterium]